jgi:hypothetical protein
MSRTRMHRRYYNYNGQRQFSLLALPASMMRHGGRTYSAWETAEAGRVTELHAREYEDHQRVGWHAAPRQFAHLPFGVTWTIG